jgi:hypothetical protein
MPAIYSWHFAGKAGGGGAAAEEGGSFTPPYSLPTSGNVVAIGTTGGSAGSFYATNPTSGVNGTMTDANWSYAVFNNYGGGDILEGMTEGGVYAVVGSGGHGVPANVGMSYFDYTDAEWKRKDPHATHDGTDFYRSTDYTTSEMDDAGGSPPYYELDGSSGIPAPCHIQSNCLAIEPSVDGSSLGSMIQMMRTAMATTAVNGVWAYAFDASTGLYTRKSTNSSTRFPVHGSSIFDATRNRYWNCGGTENTFNTVEYLDCADWTFKNTSTFTITTNDQEQGCVFMYEGLLLRHGNNDSLMCYDPDAPSAGWIELTISSGSLTGLSRLNRWIYYPPNGKFYWRSSTASDAVLYRLTPPASSPKTNGWTVDTVTLGSSMPRSTLDGDPGDQAEHYTCLQYVPSIQRLSWIPGGDEQVYLIHPGS